MHSVGGEVPGKCWCGRERPVVVNVSYARGDGAATSGKFTYDRLRALSATLPAIQSGKVENIGAGNRSDCKGAAILFDEISAARRRLRGGRRFVNHQAIASGSEHDAKGDGILAKLQR